MSPQSVVSKCLKLALLFFPLFLSAQPCPTPTATVTHPTCTVATGSIQVTSPLNTNPLPVPADLFISEVTDENVGALTYVEIYNGTGAPKNLANYKLKIYNNGNAFTSCEFPLAGILNNNDVFVVAIGSVVNQGGVVPDQVVAACAGINDNDNIRLATIADVEFDLWGRTDGVVFTPSPSGYTYRRLAVAPHPTMTWNPADWTPIDPQVYTNVGSYTYATQYEYSINGVNYQASTTFANLAPGNYNVTVRDVISGCVSSPFAVTVNPVPSPPTATPVLFCAAPNPLITVPQANIDFNNAGQTNFTVTYTINGTTYTPPSFNNQSHYDATVGVVPGDPVTFTVTWEGLCTPPLSITCYPTCAGTSITPTFTQVASICEGQPLAALPTTSNNNVVGSWSPALNNTQTTTYTFTPNANECAVATQMTIVVNPVIVPAFTQVAPICAGQTLAALPTTSNNGITGAWSPALDNTQTTTYTFVPDAGQCTPFILTTMTITVNQPVTPAFNAVNPICTGGILTPLPTTSNNGISGTWSPALDNTQTTTYTFTPNAGQCTSATLTTLTITVNPIVTPTFNAVAPICSGDALAPLPTTSTNGVTGSWSPALNNTATTTYTFIPSAGQQCVSSATLTITVTPATTPTFTPVAPICAGAPLAPLPTTSNNGITGSWSPAIDNMNTTVYTFTPNSGVCVDAVSMQIVVSPQTTPTVNVQSQCNSSLVTVTSPVGADFQYAVDGGPYQSNPNFTALAVGNHTLVANQISTSCVSNPVNFTVAPSANDVVVFTPQPLQYCDPNNDGFGVFDLTQVINFVTGGVPYTVTFHETYTDAFTDGTAIVNPSNYGSIGQGSQIVYIRVESTTTTCFEIVTLQLLINPTPVATDPGPYHECDDNYDGVANFNLDANVTPAVLAALDPATHDVTYHTSLLDAQNDANAITNVTSYPSGNATIWVRVEIIATGCYDIVELDLVVDPLPASQQPAYPPYSLCDVNAPLGYEQFDLQSQVPMILGGQTGASVTFYPSLSQAQSQTGAIGNTTSYTNASPFVQTLGIVITNSATGCYVVSTMDIRVEPLPTPIPPAGPYVVCDADQNGYAQFDLCSLTAAMNSGGYLISYHETQGDAQSGNNDLPCIYQNINAYTQVIWVRAEDALTGCVRVMPIILQVEPSPVMPATIPNLVACDQDANNQDSQTLVNLELQTPGLLLGQNGPSSDYTVTYYTSQAAATAGPGSHIVNSTSYLGTNAQVIWVRIENNSTGCFSIGSFQLEIGTPLALTTPTPLSVCDSTAPINDQYTVFDLTVKDNEITGGAPGYVVSYYPSLSDAQNNTGLITTPTAYTNAIPAVQTLGVAVSSPANCRSFTTLDIRVLPVPTPNQNPQPLAPQCENALGSGQQTFDLTTNAVYIQNSDPNVTLHYFHNAQDAALMQNEITNPGAALVGDPSLLAASPRPQGLMQYVYIVVSSNTFIGSDGQNCSTTVQQGYTINPLPVANAISEHICEDDPSGVNDGFETFDLTSYIPQLTAGNATSPASGYAVTFFEDAALSNPINNPSSYTNTSNPQTVYAVVTNTTTGCNSSTPFDIIVDPKPDLATPSDFASCDDDGSNDGYYDLPLDGYIAGILGTQSATDYTVSFYNTSLADAQAGTNAITGLAGYQAQTQTIWIRVENNLTHCYQVGSFDVIIEQYATPQVQTPNGASTICVDFTGNVVERSLTLSAVNTTNYLNTPVVAQPDYTYQWYQDGTLIPGAVGPGYTIDQPFANGALPSVFEVVMTSTSALGCSAQQSFTVTQSGVAEPLAGTVGYVMGEAFSENQTLTVMVQGWGTYQYSLNDGPRQDSPVFENVPIGSNLITVWDIEDGLANSCDALFIQQIQSIGYPHYFTPNGDGIHDTWNIVGLEDQPNTKIYIFDRFGKLIKQISSSGEGWDGTYNGQPLPSTDYWFTVDYNEQNTTRQFKAHFTLKR